MAWQKVPGLALVTCCWAGPQCKEPPDSRERLLQWAPWWCGTVTCQGIRALDEQGCRQTPERRGNRRRQEDSHQVGTQQCYVENTPQQQTASFFLLYCTMRKELIFEMWLLFKFKNKFRMKNGPDISKTKTLKWQHFLGGRMSLIRKLLQSVLCFVSFVWGIALPKFKVSHYFPNSLLCDRYRRMEVEGH